MHKIILSFIIAMSAFLISDGQHMPPGYSAYINLAVDPSLFGFNKHMHSFRNDTLTMMNFRRGTSYYRNPTKENFDTSYYPLAVADVDTIIKTIRSTDTLSSCFNFCLMDGMRFFFTCTDGNKKHEAWVGNAYDPTMFLFIDIINRYVPEKCKINYEKETLIKEKQECMKELFKDKPPSPASGP